MTRERALDVFQNVYQVLRINGAHADATLLKEALEVLKAGNDATKNEAASAEEVRAPRECPPCPKFEITAAPFEDQDYVVDLRPEWEEPWKGIMVGSIHGKGECERTAKWLRTAMPTLWRLCFNMQRPGFKPPTKATSADASPAQNPAKATTEEDPVTDEAERKCSHCDWGQFSKPCKSCPHPDEFHRYRNEQITAIRNKKETL